MDCAKAIAFLSKNKGDISDYIYNRLRGDEALPLVLIPTTCGTGSEGNGFAVLTNPENGDKKLSALQCDRGKSVHHRSGVHDDNAEESAGFGCLRCTVS